jgi:ADP-ribose pyrophosphatase
MTGYWKQIDRKTIWHSDFLSVTLDKIELPDGRMIDDFELMHYVHDSVGVIPVNEMGEILLVRAYRYLQESTDWEIPGGLVERDESSIDAARRELLEETGYTAGLWTPKLVFYPHKATCSQRYHVYLAEDLQRESPDIQQVEVTEMGFHTPEAVHNLIDEGEINDGLSLVALQRYFLQKKGTVTY